MDTRHYALLLLQAFFFGTNAQDFYKGADLSYVNELEDCGSTYFDQEGVETDVYELFANQGSNIVRLRLWHNPQWTNYSNLADVKKSIKRAKDLGMAVLLDFHYSDFWTDPGRNWRPAAWEAIDDDTILGDSLYQYTFNTLDELFEEDLLPEMVQIGNETNGNILIKRGEASIDGSTPNLYPIDWDRQAMLFNKALAAVEDFELKTNTELKTVLHVADPNSTRSWFAAATENQLTAYDIIGLSYYPQWHDLDVREVGDQIASLKEEFEKEVMIVEIGYPWSSSSSGDQANNVLGSQSKLSTYDAFSPMVQNEFLTELTWLVKENGGLGVIYWEPAWVSSSCETYWGTGSHWDNATFFDFDNKLHEGIGFLSYSYDVMPDGLKDQEVTFQLNMTGVSSVNGVFVTGDFTGETWQFLQLEDKGNDLYKLTTTIPGRSSGGYVFYNNDNWEIEWREVVPDVCAFVWDTHRYYLMKNETKQYDFAWSSCSAEVIEPIVPTLANENSISAKDFVVYPNPSSNILQLETEQHLKTVKCYDLAGNQYNMNQESGLTFNISQLQRGTYLLVIQTASGFQTIKFQKDE